MEYSCDNVSFIEPIKKIRSPMDMPVWFASRAYQDLIGFITKAGEKVQGKCTTAECHTSDTITKLIDMLQLLDDRISEIPAVEQPQRFGNKAFRTWYQRLDDECDEMLSSILTEKLKGAVLELKPYLLDSFGNNTRIDYGTGHEMAFVYFLIGLFKLNLLLEEDIVATILKVFNKYLHLVRKLQSTYRMEPAGSQGVWGLDDFQFIPYIWGSSQLKDHETITPNEIPSLEQAVQHKGDYLFFDCLNFIHTVKTGPFAEHSNVLWGVSSVKHWSKVNSGLIKMYKAEILSKFPIVQHLAFGSLISIDKAK